MIGRRFRPAEAAAARRGPAGRRPRRRHDGVRGLADGHVEPPDRVAQLDRVVCAAGTRDGFRECRQRPTKPGRRGLELRDRDGPEGPLRAGGSGPLSKRWTLVRFPLPTTPPLCSVTPRRCASSRTRSPVARGRSAPSSRRVLAGEHGHLEHRPDRDPHGRDVASRRELPRVDRHAAVRRRGQRLHRRRDLGGGLLTAAESLFNTRTAGSNTPELLVTFG